MRGTLSVLIVAAALAAACSDPSPQSPASPSSVAGGAIGALVPGAGAGAAAAADRPVPQHILHPVDFPMIQGVIAFPPRSEPNAFYQNLRALYRDVLGRQPTAPTYVDPEGQNVWLTEYFRFYLNGCSHEESTFRTITEIASGATLPTCGSERLAFPPRNLPNDFQNTLQLAYRDILGRPQMFDFIDSEGANVWLAQYLRFRVAGGCGHSAAQDRVFTEIRGGGVQPDCTALFTGTITGTVQALGTNGHPLGATPTNGVMRGTLRWNDASVDLDLYLTDGSCSGYPPTDCNILAASTAVGTNVENITRNVRTGEQYIVWVDNFSSRAQSYTVDLSISLTVAPTDGGAPTTLEIGPVRSLAPAPSKKK